MTKPVAIIERGEATKQCIETLVKAGYLIVLTDNVNGIVLSDRTLRDDIMMAALAAARPWVRDDGVERLVRLAYEIADEALKQR